MTCLKTAGDDPAKRCDPLSELAARRYKGPSTFVVDTRTRASLQEGRQVGAGSAAISGRDAHFCKKVRAEIHSARAALRNVEKKSYDQLCRTVRADDREMRAVCDTVDLEDDSVARLAVQLGLGLGARRPTWPA